MVLQGRMTCTVSVMQRTTGRTIWLWGDNRTTDRDWGGDRAKHRWGAVSTVSGQPPCSGKNAVPECGNGDAFLFKGMDHAKVRQAMRAVTKVSLLFLPLLVHLLIFSLCCFRLDHQIKEEGNEMIV